MHKDKRYSVISKDERGQEHIGNYDTYEMAYETMCDLHLLASKGIASVQELTMIDNKYKNIVKRNIYG